MQLAAARPGLIVMDSALNLLASNAEAHQILMFPRRAMKLGDLNGLAVQKIRSQIFNNQPPSHSSTVRDLRSGMRTYVCRSFFLDPEPDALPGSTVVVMLERKTTNAVALTKVFLRYGLTPREQEVVQLLVQGLTSKEIGCRMDISTHTVKAFLRLVMVKMEVSTRSGVIGKIVDANGS